MSKKAQGRKRVIAILTAVALLLTGSMIFTYWSSGITGATEEGSGGVTIGAGGVVSTTVSLDDLTASEGGLIPLDIPLGTDEVHRVTLETDAKWEDENKAATGETGELFIALTGIKVDGVSAVLDDGIWKMFNVSTSVYDITCNGAAVPVSALISMNRPADKAEFDVIAGARVEFEFEFEVVPEDGLRSLNNNAWADIKAAADVIAAYGETGAALEARVRDEFGFRVGDTKAYEIAGQTYHAQIMGFNHDEKTGGGKAGISFMNVELMANTYPMNATATTLGGWAASSLRTTMQDTGAGSIYSALPSDLQSAIVLVDKNTADGGSVNYTGMVTTSDRLWVPAASEIDGSWRASDETYTDEGTQYAYWKERLGVNPGSGANPLRVKSSAGGGVRGWWVRSPRTSSTSYYCGINATGGTTGTSPANSTGRSIPLGFCF